MKALQLRKQGSGPQAHLVDKPGPAPAATRVTVGMRTIGLCRTDLRVAGGEIAAPDGLVLGHEGAGVVVDDPTGTFQPGQTVAIDPRLPGGAFLGLTHDGLLQEMVQLPPEQLLAADGLPFPVAAYLEPVAASLAVLGARIAPEQRGLVLGDNRIAHLTTLLLRTHGYRVDWIAESVYGGRREAYDYAVETQFDKEPVQSLLTALKPGGLLVVKSRQYRDVAIPPALLVQKELTLQGVNYGAFADALVWLRQHQDVVAPLLGEHFPLRSWSHAFLAAAKPQAPKIFITI